MNKPKKRKAKLKLMEIARSFSYKLNVGNFESRDFFCSQKAECHEKDMDKISEALHDFCKAQVLRDVNKFLREKDAPNEKLIPVTAKKMEEIKSSLQGKSRAERADMFQESRDAAMRLVADEENQYMNPGN